MRSTMKQQGGAYYDVKKTNNGELSITCDIINYCGRVEVRFKWVIKESLQNMFLGKSCANHISDMHPEV